MIKKTINPSTEILHNLEYEAMSVTVDKTTTGTVLENGRKILKAGKFLAGDGASIFEDRSKKVKKVEGTAPTIDGVLLYDVDVTDKDAVASCVFKGTLRSDKCDTLTDKSKLPLIKFVKGV